MVVNTQYAGVIKPLTVTKITSNKTSPENEKKTKTPWNINMEPSNQQLRKENDLANLHDYVPC